MENGFTVTALGSCRIVNPMRLASNAALITLNNADVYGYVHSPDEVIQAFDYFDGMELPDTVLPYLAGSRSSLRRTSRSHPDIYLIEISSLNSICFNGWALQLNYFAERFRRYPDLYCTYLESPAEGQRDRRTIALARSENFAALAGNDRRVLVDAYSRRLAREDFRNGVLAILERVDRPILFVTHIDVADASGKFIEARRQIARWLGEMAEGFGISVFDPTPHVLINGVENALADGGQSRTHYTEAFELLLANRLVEEMTRARSPFRTPNVARVSNAVPRVSKFLASDSNARDEALKLIRAGDLRGASALARVAIAESPPCPRAMSILAQAALRAGEATAALDFALRTNEVDSAETSATVVAAKALTKLRKYDLAAEKWEEVSRHRSGSVWPLIEAARCRLRAKSPEAALELVGRSLRLERGDTLSLAIQAEALFMLQRWNDLADTGVLLAQSAPNAAVAILQSMMEAKQIRGISRIAYAVRGAPTPCSIPAELIDNLRLAAEDAVGKANWQAAGEYLRALLAFDADGEKAGRTLADILGGWLEKANRFAKTGALEDAMAACEIALEIDPYHTGALRQAATVAEKASALELAGEFWIRSAENETDPAALARAARGAELAERDEEALVLYQRALTLDPDHRKAGTARKSLTRRLGKKGRKLEAEGDAAAATRVASAVLKVEPEDPVCSKILRRQSGHVVTLLRQAREAGDFARQETLARELLELDPRRLEALRILSTANMKSGHFPEAADLLRRIVELKPGQAAHWVKLSRCLRMLKRFDEAIIATREALARDPNSRAAQKTLSDLEARARPAIEPDALLGAFASAESTGHGHKESLIT